jgi:AraC family transcriptional regulator, activator of mtrCDE
VYGESPLGFVQRVRLWHAATLLSTTDLSVKVVAASVGYASRSHFSRSFRAAYGVDPRTYRQIRTEGGGATDFHPVVVAGDEG